MLHRGAVTGQPAAILEASPTTWRLVVAATAGALVGGGAAIAEQAATIAGGKAALVLVASVAKAEYFVALAVFREAPGAVTIFPEHPHEEGRNTVVFEVEGAPPAQAACAGKCLPSAG